MEIAVLLPDVEDREMGGRLLPGRWEHAPSSSGTGRSEGNVLCSMFVASVFSAWVLGREKLGRTGHSGL